ncbi:MAG: hypothetical protein JW753_03395 [Dehalococcoidia bacterium]|nr:hypothetical protein [Dehalococcoidia bacterium]
MRATAAVPIEKAAARSTQIRVNLPDSGRVCVVVRAWLFGIARSSAAMLSSWLLAGCGTTVNDAFTAPPEVTVVVVLSL